MDNIKTLLNSNKDLFDTYIITCMGTWKQDKFFCNEQPNPKHLGHYILVKLLAQNALYYNRFIVTNVHVTWQIGKILVIKEMHFVVYINIPKWREIVSIYATYHVNI